MNDATNRNIVLMMIFLGGFIIVFTVVVFIIFYRFLEREREAGERFREHVAARRKAESEDQAPE